MKLWLNKEGIKPVFITEYLVHKLPRGLSVQHFGLHHVPQLVECAFYTVLYTGNIISGEPSAPLAVVSKGEKTKGGRRKAKCGQKTKKQTC